jgi:SagB-type dehydrogenase family enzyme
LGRADDSINFGGTYRFLNLTSPPSNSKNTNFKNFITLPKPDMNNLLKNDLSFTQILENRRSYRKFENGEGLNKALLGDFLYRSVGVRKVGKNSLQDAIYKPFPSAGALHEIEFYLVINNSQDFNKDIYFYDSCKNTLHGLEVKEKYIKKIISNARTAMGRDSSFPDALVVLTSRFGKNAWKYQKIAYRCTLITVGAIFQTMSLVASALNIGSCVIGSGDPYLFGEATNIPLLEEGTVGEFALGAISSV